MSLVAQQVKNLPATQETPVRFLGWEDPLEKETPPTWVSLRVSSRLFYVQHVFWFYLFLHQNAKKPLSFIDR